MQIFHEREAERAWGLLPEDAILPDHVATYAVSYRPLELMVPVVRMALELSPGFVALDEEGFVPRATLGELDIALACGARLLLACVRR